MTDWAVQDSKIIHILEGRRCDGELEVTYSGQARLSGDEATIDIITDPSGLVSAHRLVRGQGFAMEINLSYEDTATQLRYSGLHEALVKVLATTQVCCILLRTDKGI